MTAPVPQPPVPRPHGVRRSRTEAVLGGVCAGVARSAGLDPLLLRVVVVAVTMLTGGGAALAYLAAWVLIPRADAPETPPLHAVAGSTASTGEGTGAGARTAWTAAGNDLRSFAAELRRPAPVPDIGGEPGSADEPEGAAEPNGSAERDAMAEPDGVTAGAPAADADPAAPPAGSIPKPRSPFAAADDAATAFGDRLRTPEVQAGARKAAASVSEALNASVDELGRRIRRDPS